jgi:hypothetical protein
LQNLRTSCDTVNGLEERAASRQLGDDSGAREGAIDVGAAQTAQQRQHNRQRHIKGLR